MHFTLFLLSALLLGEFSLCQSPATASRVNEEIMRVKEARSYGAQYYPVTFSPYRLFWNSLNEEQLDAAEARNDHQIVEAVIDEGLIPLGVFPTWILPPFADAPREPASLPEGSPIPPEARISCIPPVGSSEYDRLTDIRNEMFATLVEEYPSVRRWVVGYEPSFPFFDCAGRQLNFQTLVPHIANTLRGITAAVRAVDPGFLVIAHYLGQGLEPIELDGTSVQPREILGALATEIGLRGESTDLYYDDLITSIAPDLGRDREPEPPTFHLSSSKQEQVTSRFARLPNPGRPRLKLGWGASAYWSETFSTNTSDLVSSYAAWNDVRTDDSTTHIEPTSVSGGEAEMEMADGGETYTILGAVTHPDEDVIPFDDFDSTTYYRNKWIVVSDFYPGTDPNPDGIHKVVFLRINDKTWNEEPDQTRFGSFVYGGNWTAGACSNEPCGVLQLTGVDITDSSKGKSELVEFDLDEFPWSYGAHLYRVQIIEEEYFHLLSVTWLHRWKAEAVDLTDADGIGSSVWIDEWTLENIYGIEEPALTSSKIGFGFGPATDPNFTGSVNVDFVGTNHWDY